MLIAGSVLITRFEILASCICYIIIPSNIYSTPKETGSLKSLKYHPKSVHDMIIKSVTEDNNVSMYVWIIQLALRHIFPCRQAHR